MRVLEGAGEAEWDLTAPPHSSSWEASPLQYGAWSGPAALTPLRTEDWKKKLKFLKNKLVGWTFSEFYFVNILWKTTFIIVEIDKR